MTFARILCIAAVFGLTSLGTATDAQTKLMTVRVATIPTDIGAEVYYARDMGIFKKAGFDVEITPISSGSAITAAVASNAMDVGYSNLVSISIAHQAVSRERSRWENDRRERTRQPAGVRHSRLNGTEWRRSYPAQIRRISVRGAAEAVKSGRVDAAALEATNTQDLGKPTSDLRRLANVYDAISPRFAPSAYFTTSTWIAAHPTEAKAFAAVLYQTAVLANANHAASAVILAKYALKSVADVQDTLRVAYATRTNPDYVQPVIDVAAKYGALKAAFPAADILAK